MGKELRKQVPHAFHGKWSAAGNRSDPIGLLEVQDKGRIKRLVPIRYGRMLDSPFTFYRGAAVLMASDLAGSPNTGLKAILCGDAHLSNFGIFATPERRMVFDINDFDEAFPGHWEWDLKRLAASAVIGGRDNGFSDSDCRDLAEETALAYCRAIACFAKLDTLDRWYYHVNIEAVEKVFRKSSKKGRKSAVKMITKARRHTHEQTVEKLTGFANGRRRIRSDPPLVIPVGNMALREYIDRKDVKTYTRKCISEMWRQYVKSLPDERRYLLARYRISDVALRVGGIGSVGTRCYIALLTGKSEEDALLLQFKEAGPSVLEQYVGRKGIYQSHGQRVVTAQRLMEATTDIFLGWSRGDHSGLDYYWRQLKDMKGAADVSSMDKTGLLTYLTVCSSCLARAHARTGASLEIHGYLGKGRRFARAIAKFAILYADQNERDYARLVKAAKSGRIQVDEGI